jgi:hypothetical protein
VSVPWKCAFCPAEYSTQEEVDRHIESKWGHLPERLLSAEQALKDAREHAEHLDKNWSFMHEASMRAIRNALGMAEATVPEMVEAIIRLKGPRHCFSRSCLRGSQAGDRATAMKNPFLFSPMGCECSCGACIEASLALVKAMETT